MVSCLLDKRLESCHVKPAVLNSFNVLHMWIEERMAKYFCEPRQNNRECLSIARIVRIIIPRATSSHGPISIFLNAASFDMDARQSKEMKNNFSFW